MVSDSPMSQASNQIIVLSDDLSRTQDDQESLSIEQGQYSSSVEAPAAEADGDEDEDDDEMAKVEAEEMENNNYQLMVIPEQDREYGCRYCQKRFTNKQALGGHQNAHKVERLMEKSEQDTSAAGMGFFVTHSPYHGRMSMAAAYHRQPNFLHRAPLYNWSSFGRPPSPSPPHGCIYHPYSSVPAPRLPPALPAHPHYADIRLPNFGPGSSNAFRPGFDREGFPEVPPGFAPRSRVINLRNVPEEPNESGLDLSLRLGYEDEDIDDDHV